ncbi:hypothetical protein BDK51DRAFT_42133, partial [Blyttiomyces helicus]
IADSAPEDVALATETPSAPPVLSNEPEGPNALPADETLAAADEVPTNVFAINTLEIEQNGLVQPVERAAASLADDPAFSYTPDDDHTFDAAVETTLDEELATLSFAPGQAAVGEEEPAFELDLALPSDVAEAGEELVPTEVAETDDKDVVLTAVTETDEEPHFCVAELAHNSEPFSSTATEITVQVDAVVAEMEPELPVLEFKGDGTSFADAVQDVSAQVVTALSSTLEIQFVRKDISVPTLSPTPATDVDVTVPFAFSLPVAGGSPHFLPKGVEETDQLKSPLTVEAPALPADQTEPVDLETPAAELPDTQTGELKFAAEIPSLIPVEIARALPEIEAVSFEDVAGEEQVGSPWLKDDASADAAAEAIFAEKAEILDSAAIREEAEAAEVEASFAEEAGSFAVEDAYAAISDISNEINEFEVSPVPEPAIGCEVDTPAADETNRRGSSVTVADAAAASTLIPSSDHADVDKGEVELVETEVEVEPVEAEVEAELIEAEVPVEIADEVDAPTAEVAHADET